ncbi:hypothetical protein TanjilG_06047 [Lupinus angustifolius]|uniref:RRM domain-containing protein n=1 Tax=Lupinus angustifolius TaxID=3871 RepID=A0A4P1RJR6_LUPAN|nr:PREDICTED: UBP1-associated protein 2A-like [Lupinus angustifolius]XP_019442853.1 PREDICTED: UBP1-associated protein 2A-like [Lupinus angustifolius]XP_019442854.1 PREDICTED: UBP1-associated protein 2A-like [Lupinus angustifolius]OIW12258.1 hypothetical protein TanjilG_06047 [Lupinus angustifolius]
MARKRKLPPNSTPSEQPPLKQHQQQQQQQQPQLDSDEEYEEIEVEEEVEELEQEEEDEEELEEQNDVVLYNYNNNQTVNLPSTSSTLAGDDDDDPIQNLLEHFGKDQLATLLCDAATNHRDVADRIRNTANADPSHRKIFVHGLGWDTTAETLTSAFRQYGEVEDCKAVADKITGKSKGYGFILFKTRSGARKALEQPQKKIGNRLTSCQLASLGPVQQQPNNVAQASYNNSHAPSKSAAFAVPVGSEYTQRKIFVSNVGAELDPQRLLAFFSRFGEIEEGPLGLDKVTGKPKGFCLFVYKRIESAKKALEEPHKAFEGHVLHCQQAIDGPKPGKLQQQQQQPQTQRMPIAVGAATTTPMQFQRSGNSGFVSGALAATPGHLMAPAGPVIGFNQGTAAVPMQTLDPALGQALTALLASHGAAGLGLNGLLGTLGSSAAVNPGVPSVGHGMHVGYNSQANVNPGTIGGYGNQVGFQGAYPNQQVGQGGSARGQQQQQQRNAGQYGGVAPFTGH